MDENQIDLVLHSNLDKKSNYYRGSYACDELKGLYINNLSHAQCFAFVCNTLKRNQSGMMGHWVCISVRVEHMLKKIHLKFIDSYKIPYTAYGLYITDYIDSLRLLALENNFKFTFEEVPFRMQASDSKTCGIYALYGVMGLKHCDSATLKKIFSRFDIKNRKHNDRNMVDYIIKKWPRHFCSDAFGSTKGPSFCPKKLFDSFKCLKNCYCKKECCKTHRETEYIRSKVKNIFI